ncbi:hypothetical protein T4B_12772 [Trichinella pseudospiralis]|uniref:Uncharacterized protein n=1 Tax=Trichinella pseudospiralis TaxID=6337 RepID=A0A0V1H8S7_TRIPS|nr:hypothetical protein T4A_9852 [Trichinella pseudospiralis]KRZ06861.1 hypothetical protein T4B_12772 [Trichinella pseudospiralis]
MNYYNIGELTHANIAYVAFQRIQSCSRKLAVLQISVHPVPGHSSPHLFSWHFLQILLCVKFHVHLQEQFVKL